MTTKTTMTTQARHYASAAQLEGSGISTWLTRGANFVVAVSQGSAGSVLSRDENPDEYMVYLVDAAAVIEEAFADRGMTVLVLRPRPIA